MPIRVFVVDDSAFMRKLITEIINEDPELEVAGYARNGQDALRKLAKLDVDVVTLDVEMPIMDGLETLKHIMETKPLPVVMLSRAPLWHRFARFGWNCHGDKREGTLGCRSSAATFRTSETSSYY